MKLTLFSNLNTTNTTTSTLIEKEKGLGAELNFVLEL